MKQKTLEQFIEQSISIHGNVYDYSETIYKNNNTYLKIICNDHGAFMVEPKRHIIKGQGCPVCGISYINRKKHIESTRLSHEDFLQRARLIHGEKYDYSLCLYESGNKKIPILCKIHDIFYQKPENHINSKQGCKKCYNEKRKGRVGYSGYCQTFFDNYPYKKIQPAIIYVARMQHKNDDFIKIGITIKNSIKERYYFKTKHGTKITPLIESQLTLYEAFLRERYLHTSLNLFRYFPNRKFGGYTECFKINKHVISFLDNHFKTNIEEKL